MSFRLVVAGMVLETLSQDEFDSQWVNLPNPLEWDAFHEAVSYAASESSNRDGQLVEVVAENGGVWARVACPLLATPQGPPAFPGAPLTLQEGFEA